MNELKAIETIYNGYRFRSRLEARWAVFFDMIGIPYRYEPEGYKLDGIWYLPDFEIELDDKRPFVEIKPTWPPNNHECEKIIRLCRISRRPIYLLAGDVWSDAYKGVVYFPVPNILNEPELCEEFMNVLFAEDTKLLTKLPIQDEPNRPKWRVFGDTKTRTICFSDDPAHFMVGDFTKGFIALSDHTFIQCSECQNLSFSGGGFAWKCNKCNTIAYDHPSVNKFFDVYYDSGILQRFPYDTPHLKNAYVAARRARFEHGEKP